MSTVKTKIKQIKERINILNRRKTHLKSKLNSKLKAPIK